MNITDIQNFFTAADRNHNGYLTASELKKAISSQVLDVQSSLKFFLNEKGKIDSGKFNMYADGDKKISLNELKALLTTQDEEDDTVIVDDDALEAKYNNVSTLDAVDTNNDGKISAGEIVKAYKNASDDNTVKELLKQYVTVNDKGKVKANTANIKAQAGGNSYLTFSDLNDGLNKLLAPADDTKDTDNTNNENDNADDNTETANEINLFAAMDTNANGKITAKEILKLYKTTTNADLKEMLENFVSTNNKGKLQVDLSKIRILSGGKKYLTQKDLISADTNGNGIGSAAEVKKVLSKTLEFSVLDINGDGKVKLNEIKKYAKALPDSGFATYIASLASNKEMKRVFKLISNGKNHLDASDLAKFDTNNNGVICAEELAALKQQVNGVAKVTV